MPKYVPSKLKEFNHPTPSRPQHSPYPSAPRFKNSQKPVPEDNTTLLLPDKIKRIQQIVGSFLYYGRAIDLTIIKALNTLATQQSHPTITTEKHIDQFLDYCATHPDAKIRFFASDMLLQIHSDAAYMNETKARSTAGGHYFLGNKIVHNTPIFLNEAIYSLCKLSHLSFFQFGKFPLHNQQTVKQSI